MGLGVGRLGRRLGVGGERRTPARVVEQLAQNRVLLELREELDELGQRGGVLEDDAGHVVRRAAVECVVLGELGGVARKATLKVERVPASGLALIKRGPGLGREVLEACELTWPAIKTFLTKTTMAPGARG